MTSARVPPRRAVTGKPRRRAVPARPGLSHERDLWGAGHRVVAGVDEVGRGAWAGPLSVGVAVLCESPPRIPKGLRDSKQLTEDVREAIFDRVAAWCAGWAVGHAGPEECDRLGMTAALRLATRRALAQLSPDLVPDAVVLDGTFDFVSPPHEPQLFDADGTVEPEAARDGAVRDGLGGDGPGGDGRPGETGPEGPWGPGMACGPRRWRRSSEATPGVRRWRPRRCSPR